MTDLRKAAEMALEVMSKEPESFTLWVEDMRQAREALQQALAQPEQEPVAWVDITDEGKWSVRFAVPALSLPDGTKFYTAPPKREWVGLTDEEVDALLWKLSLGAVDEDVRTIEAKLKEKNT